MSASALVAIADGSEEMEAIIVTDVLRRAGIRVTLASTHQSSNTITASRGVKIVADTLITDVVNDQFDLIVLPGGMPGAANLGDCDDLVAMLRQQMQRKGWIGAICAAPAVVLQRHDLLRTADKAIRATCHPSFHTELAADSLSNERVVIDGNLVTSQAPGTAFEFALTLVECLCGRDKREEITGPLVLPICA